MLKKFGAILIPAVLACTVHASEVTLSVAAFPAVDDIVKRAAVAWEKQNPGVKVKVISRAYADHHTAMTTALATSSDLPDVMAIEYGYLGRFAQSGGLTDFFTLESQLANQLNQWVPYAVSQGRFEGFGQVALPTDIGPGALFYRSDLLAACGMSEQEMVRSWDSYLKTGDCIKAKTGAALMPHARDIKDIVIRAGVKAGQGVYFDANGKSVVASDPRFKQAFELAKQVRDRGLDAKINAWSNEWSEAFKRGTVASQMMGAWLGGHLANWLAPNTAGKWRSTQLPNGAYASWGGTFYAIPAKAKQKQQAMSLVKYLTQNIEQQQLALEQFNAFPALVKAQEGSQFNAPIAFLGGQAARQQWRDAALRIVPTRVFKHDAIAEEIINAELDLVLLRGKSVTQALQDADRTIARRARR
jgi:multiple sugar transport system substrate-binding protein